MSLHPTPAGHRRAPPPGGRRPRRAATAPPVGGRHDGPHVRADRVPGAIGGARAAASDQPGAVSRRAGAAGGVARRGGAAPGAGRRCGDQPRCATRARARVARRQLGLAMGQPHAPGLWLRRAGLPPLRRAASTDRAPRCVGRDRAYLAPRGPPRRGAPGATRPRATHGRRHRRAIRPTPTISPVHHAVGAREAGGLPSMGSGPSPRLSQALFPTVILPGCQCAMGLSH